MKIFNIVGMEGTYLNIVKATYDKPTANIFNAKELETFPLISGRRKWNCYLLGK